MPLHETRVRTAQADLKPQKLADERGLYLLVNPGGSKLWRLKYRIGGKEKLLALGGYPDVSLKRARELRDEARQLMTELNGVKVIGSAEPPVAGQCAM